MVFTSDRVTDLETLQTLGLLLEASNWPSWPATVAKMTGTHYFKMTKGQQL